MIFFGCDGGSTKTEFLICDSLGTILSHEVYPSIGYAELGKARFQAEMRAAFSELLKKASLSSSQVDFTCLGMTGFGENERFTAEMATAAREYFSSSQVFVLNDAVISWSGSLVGQPGINILAGIGSRAYGEDITGSAMRAGGWSLRYNDEGSCTWIGSGVLSLFFKQADGRLPKTHLYKLVCDHFSLNGDMQILERIESGSFRPSNLAELQRLACDACMLGDLYAQELYASAAKELAQLAKPFLEQLDFGCDPVKIAYSGGLFYAGELILTPLGLEIEALGGRLVSPAYPPIIGSVIYPARRVLTFDKLLFLAETLAAKL